MPSRKKNTLSSDKLIAARTLAEKVLWIRRGATFETAVDHARARQAFFRSLEKGKQDLEDIRLKFHKVRRERTMQVKDIAKSIGTESKITRGGRPRGDYRYSQAAFLASPFLQSFCGSLRPRQPVTRRYNLKFYGGQGTGKLSNIPRVTDVENGVIGWQDPHIGFENKATDKVIFGGLNLAWGTTVQRQGEYQYHIGASSVYVDVDFEVDGRGLWGLDASILIDHSVMLTIIGPTGLRFLVNESSVYAYADAWAWWGGQAAGGSEHWFPVGEEGLFYAYPGEEVTLSLNLGIWTWADGGGVARYEINDYWFPANTADSDNYIELL